MPEHLPSGVYVEEAGGGLPPIAGVSTSTAGFVGGAERGPEDARLINSFQDFQHWYGGNTADASYLAYAVEGFFTNGGERCFVTRVVSRKATAASGSHGTFHVAAIGRGAWGNDVKVKIEGAGKPDDRPRRRKLEIYYRDELVETHDDGDDLVRRVDSTSPMVRVWWDGDPVALEEGTEIDLTGGDDAGDSRAEDYLGDLEPIPVPDGASEGLLGQGRGLAALGEVAEVSILSVPDEVREGLTSITTAVVEQCEKLEDRFAIVSVGEQPHRDVEDVRPTHDTSYAGFYYPWIEVFDPAADDHRSIPPSGHVAGIFARIDRERGVYTAPANEVVRGATDLELAVTTDMQDVLNPRGVNCIRDFRPMGRGIRLWGARTMSSNPEWRYVNVRRLAIYIEQSIEQGTQWVVFGPNDQSTWSAVRQSVGDFLDVLWRDGGLMGATPDEAFFVRCDRTTMTQDDIDNGRLVCLIGVAPVRPAEFVILRILQKTAGPV